MAADRGAQLKELAAQLGVSESLDLDDFLDASDADIWTEHGSVGGDSQISVSLPPSLLNSDEESAPGASPGPRQRYPVPRSTQEERVAGLLHEKRLLEVDLARERQRYREDLGQVQLEARGELGEIREAQRRLTAELPLLRSRLTQAKKELGDMRCPPTLYHELKQRPEELLTMREYVLLRSHELVAAHRATAESLRLDLETTRRESNSSKAKTEELAASLAHTERRFEVEVARLKEDLSVAEGAAARLRARYDEARSAAEDLRSKGDQYDVVSARTAALERDRDAAQETAARAAALAGTAQRECAAARDDLSAATQQVELLKVDKSYLQRGLEDKTRELDVVTDKLERQQDKTRAAKRETQQRVEELQSLRERVGTEYDQRLKSEVDSLKEEGRRNLDNVRAAHREVVEREVRTLREARDDAMDEAQRMTAKFEELRREHDELKISVAASAASRDADLSELGAQLKMKAFEAERIGVSFEERMESLRRARLENTMLQRQLDASKADFAALVARTDAERASRDAEIDALKQRLEVYQTLELELDTAILEEGARAGAGAATESKFGEDGAAGQGGADDETKDPALAARAVLASMPVPTSTRRRVQQSVQLAHRLVASERELSASAAECTALRAECAQLREAVEREKQLSADAQQPQTFMVEALRRREDELKEAKARMQHLEEQCSERAAQAAAAHQERDAMFGDLQRVLEQRAALEALVREQQQPVGLGYRRR